MHQFELEKSVEMDFCRQTATEKAAGGRRPDSEIFPDVESIAIRNISSGIRAGISPIQFMDSVNKANSALGNRSFMQFIGEQQVQRRYRNAHSIAAGGIKGPGRPLTHLDTLQQAFGHHDVSGMREHTGPGTRAVLDSLGAKGYSSTGRMALSDSPDLYTQAHEAAHGVQQAALGSSMALEGGVGAAGDRYERHADEVADAVVAGKRRPTDTGPVGAATHGCCGRSHRRQCPAADG